MDEELVLHEVPEKNQCPKCGADMFAEQIDWFDEICLAWYCTDEDCEFGEHE